MNISSVMITILLIGLCINDGNACNDAFCRLTNKLKDGYNSWVAVKDLVVICPMNSVTCSNDKLGYGSLRRILKKLDKDDDNSLIFAEGVMDTSHKIIKELNRKERVFNVLLNPEQSSISFLGAWDKWTQSEG